MNRLELLEIAKALGLDVNAKTTKKELVKMLDPETETKVESQDFKERWDKADILVIGAAYGESEDHKWGCIDPNYIGIGFAYSDQVIDINPSNPLADNWEEKDIWLRLLDLAQAENKTIPASKKFDSIWFDIGVTHHMPSIMKTKFLVTADRVLKDGGYLFVHDSDKIAKTLEENNKWVRVPEMDMTLENNPCLELWNFGDLKYIAFAPVRS